MTVRSTEALRRLCELRDWEITNLEANKLLYFAQMISLGESEGEKPLFADRFQAWDYGPVLPTAYHAAKMYGNKPIKPYLFRGKGKLGEAEDVLARTLEIFGGMSSAQLVAESHWEKGAWAFYYRPGAKSVEIPNGAIFTEFKARIGNGEPAYD